MKRRIRTRKNKKIKAICTDLSQTPKERLMTALNSLNRLRLRNPFYDGDWRALYSAEIRSVAEELEQRAEMAEILAEAAQTDKDRAISELADFHLLHRLAFQIAQAVQMKDVPAILPMYVSLFGRHYTIEGDAVTVWVSIGFDDSVRLTVPQPGYACDAWTVELDDEEITPWIASRIAETYSTTAVADTTPWFPPR